jgi:hypothetical protein
LNLFGPYGLDLTFIPHWNNTDGGAGLDTSRCFLGQTRFSQLLALLPGNHIVIGIDEQTALLLDCLGMCCQVMGLGSVTIIKGGQERVIETGGSFDLGEIGECSRPGDLAGLPSDIWEAALNAQREQEKQLNQPPPAVIDLVEQRKVARAEKNWPLADDLRVKILAFGWEVKDTPGGIEITKRR